MNRLAIETSTDKASVAVSVQGRILSQTQDGVRLHAQTLLPLIEELLGQAGVSMSQIDALVFGQGPGSFTGLRIACSVAKGLAYARDLPVYPVSTLQAVGFSALQREPVHADSRVLVLLDARMHQLYWSCVSQDRMTQARVSNAADIYVEEAGSLRVAGVGFEPYLPHLPETLRARIAGWDTIYPDAACMLQLVERGGIPAVTAQQALPVYVRDKVTD